MATVDPASIPSGFISLTPISFPRRVCGVGVLRLCVCLLFVSVRVSRQDVLNAVGVFQLPAMALMFPEREGMRVDPDSRPPPDGQKVRKRDTPHVDACPESLPCRVVSFLSFPPWGGCSARDFFGEPSRFSPVTERVNSHV